MASIETKPPSLSQTQQKKYYKKRQTVRLPDVVGTTRFELVTPCL